MSSDPILRPMRAEDLGPALEVERELFPEDAWSEAMLANELAGAPDTRYYVAAEEDGTLIGYAGLLAVGAEADVQTIAVRQPYWGHGIGGALLRALLEEAARRDCDEVFLEVRADNERAQALYRRFGFERIGVRKGYYQPSNTDALVMRLSGVRRKAAAHG